MATGQLDDADLALLRSSERSRLLLALAAILAHVGRAEEVPGPAAARPLRPAAAWELLATVQRADPAAVEAVLADPAVGLWAFPVLRKLRHGAAAVGAQIPAWAAASVFAALAGAAAVRAGVRTTVRVPAHHGRVWLPSLGVTDPVGRGTWAVATLDHGPNGTVVFGENGSVRLPDDPARVADGWHPLPRPGGAGGPYGTGAVALDHLSPFRDFRSLREPAPLAPRDLERWHELLAESDALLRREQPDAHRLVSGTVRTIVPVEGPSPLRVVSATDPDAPGAVTMSLPLDAAAMAAVLIHEARHSLLGSLAALVPLLVPVQEGPEPTYFAPWRADPRPLRGLLFGTHAFAGVMAFWRARRAVEGDRAEFEYALHRHQVRPALAALRNAGGLTPAGGLIVEGLAASVHGGPRCARRRSPAPAAGGGGPQHGGVTPRHLAALAHDDERAAWRVAHLVVDDDDALALARRLLAGRPAPAQLPPARLRPHASGAPRPPDHPAARTWLARLWCTDRQAFAAVRRALARGRGHPLGVKGATLADALLVAGDTAAALHRFRRQPPSPDAWTGIGLAQRSGPARLLVERPELVLALHEALLRLGAPPPGAERLAGWLGAGARPPGSDAQRVDVAVGPDAVGGVLGGLVVGPEHPAE
ncbi:aKG-HExxH-type peptide beta-hydroxylase [Streptomyces glaucescens]|uniref:aKG-HExxH-type peptide beta-hydroxylase n=1 Tax=Streptomyces glaucescens TaxID=1907 RepID=UPI00131D1321|nr:HEXXH motif-containing putative peptide modification protein [Streptomyces glaucescens]